MSIQTALDEYNLALKQGQKEYRELVMEGRSPYPAQTAVLKGRLKNGETLDDILPENNTDSVVDVGLVEIPSERIIGTKSAGRITAFTASFRPLLDSKSEFAVKWVNLCAAHLGETGITDPILCYEYLGNFYVQEGNKRVSVLRHFGSPRIPGTVKRIVPPMSNEVITLVKDTSLSRIIALQEIIWAGQAFLKGTQGISGAIWPLFFTGIYYLIFSGLLTLALGKLEKKLDYFKA